MEQLPPALEQMALGYENYLEGATRLAPVQRRRTFTKSGASWSGRAPRS